ncbi:MAG: DEAD/DEAH box helicase, partial [Methanomicrobiales archaeon]|nr:DEAD/DEAH box helicase [Methanomicrobiales archaeon]
ILQDLEQMMVGSMEPVLPLLLEKRLLKKAGSNIELTPLSRVMVEHFMGVERLDVLQKFIRKLDNPAEIVAELECAERER